MIFLNVNIGIEQGFTLSLIILTLYILPIFHIFYKFFFNISISFLYFIDNKLLILQEKSFEKTNTFLFYSYNIILSLLKHFGLIIKYRKSEVFYFSRSHGIFNLPSLSLSPFRGFILCLKKT